MKAKGMLRAASGLSPAGAAALACLCCVGCAGPPPIESPRTIVGGADAPREIVELARTDHAKLLRMGLQRYKATVRCYTCTLIKRERIRGNFGPEQHIRVKFKERPFSVVMTWVKNSPPGDRTIYVEGKYNGRMLIRPKGLSWLVGTVTRHPTSEEVMANTLRPITMFGFRRCLERLLEVCEQADRRGDAVARFEGYANVGGRKTLKLVRELPQRGGYPAAKTVVYLSVDRLLPLRLETYDWEGRPLCYYEYRDVNFEANLTDGDFAPRANGMKSPKL